MPRPFNRSICWHPAEIASSSKPLLTCQAGHTLAVGVVLTNLGKKTFVLWCGEFLISQHGAVVGKRLSSEQSCVSERVTHGGMCVCWGNAASSSYFSAQPIWMGNPLWLEGRAPRRSRTLSLVGRAPADAPGHQTGSSPLA